jgi:hypothetical protein
MIAPLVLDVIVICCDELYAPAAGLNTGAATVPVIVYAATVTLEAVQSVLQAMALYVAPGLLIVIADE